MHLEAAAALQGLLQHGQGLGQHIGHAAAHLAVGVGVVAQRVVKAVAGPGDRNLEQLTVLTQQVQVAVYGAQAHFGVLRPHPGIDKNPVRLHKPFGQLPRWGAKNVLSLILIALLL